MNTIQERRTRYTIMNVEPAGPGKVVVWFKGKKGGAPGWQWILDGFVEVLRTARAARGRDWRPPQDGKMVGQGRRLKMSTWMYLEVRGQFLEIEEVVEALASGYLLLRDDWLLNEPEEAETDTSSGEHGGEATTEHAAEL